MDDKQAQQMRAILISKQLEIDTLKRKIKEMENDSTRQRSNTPREKAVRSTTSSDSDK